jgi:DNA replication protein DnaC
VPCEICDDTGWRTIDVDGVPRVTRCECRKIAAAARLMVDSGVPPRYRRCDLDNFQDYNVERGILFLGQPGLGKTHLATATLKLAIQRTGLRGLFFDSRELLRRIKETYDPVSQSTESDLIRPVTTADLLVLDDIGAEKSTEWVEETLHLIVNTRYNDRRPTIFTTNYPLEAPADAKHAETLLERIGFRWYSRLQEMCEFVTLKGVDYRELGPNQTIEELVELTKRGSKTHKNLPSPGSRAQLKAKLKSGPAPDLKWSGGRAGS